MARENSAHYNVIKPGLRTFCSHPDALFNTDSKLESHKLPHTENTHFPSPRF